MSQKTKDRWAVSNKVTEILGIRPTVAWKILNRLKQEELLEGILSGIDEAIELGREMAGDQPKKQSQMCGDVKLMLLAFDKIGDMERIKVAYRKALDVCS